jgi:hypothetical protein
MARELEVVVAANKELHQLRERAEGCEANAENKLRLEKQRYQGNGSILDMSRVVLVHQGHRVDSSCFCRAGVMPG